VWAFSSPELSLVRSQYKQFEPLGWFTKKTPSRSMNLNVETQGYRVSTTVMTLGKIIFIHEISNATQSKIDWRSPKKHLNSRSHNRIDAISVTFSHSCCFYSAVINSIKVSTVYLSSCNYSVVLQK
jgi:hypothetical protein